MNKKLILTIGLIIYLIIAFVTEIFYRNKLYDKSVDYIEKIKQDGFFKFFYFFWSYIFAFGTMLIGLIITLFCYPINIFYSHLSIRFFFTFIMSILKSLYSSPRPYWDIYVKKQEGSPNKFLSDPTECDGEFGNPSGHAILATNLLILWDLFLNSNYFKSLSKQQKILIKYSSLILSILCIICIIYSRVHRQVHSFNQILFGTILGVAGYFTFCQILEINKIEPKIFMENIIKFKFIVIPIFIILFGISLTLGLTRHNEDEDEYKKILKLYCDIDNEDKMFGRNTALLSTMIFAVIGGYIGLLFLNYQIKKNYSNNENLFYNWNKGSKLATLEVTLFTGLLSVIFFIPMIFINNYVAKIVIWSLIFFCFGFCMFGFGFYYGCVLFKKKEIEKENLFLIYNYDNDLE